MKLYVMPDLEDVAGVMNFEDWCSPGTRYSLCQEVIRTGKVGRPPKRVIWY